MTGRAIVHFKLYHLGPIFLAFYLENCGERHVIVLLSLVHTGTQWQKLMVTMTTAQVRYFLKSSQNSMLDHITWFTILLSASIYPTDPRTNHAQFRVKKILRIDGFEKHGFFELAILILLNTIKSIQRFLGSKYGFIFVFSLKFTVINVFFSCIF